VKVTTDQGSTQQSQDTMESRGKWYRRVFVAVEVGEDADNAGFDDIANLEVAELILRRLF
jgi:hypothetical protein